MASVYFVTGGTVASMHEGTNNIKKISLKDGSVSVLVKGSERIPDHALAADEKFLYWTDGGNILRVARDGAGQTSETIIKGAPTPDEILLDSENFYWLIWSGEGSPPHPVMSAPRTGEEPKKLTPPETGTSGLSLDKDFVYWMTGDGMKKIPKTGGEVTQLAPSINHTMEFVIDETNVYYFDEVPGTGSFGPVALKKVSKAGADPVVLDQGEAGWINHLAVDSTQIYFTDSSKVYGLRL